MMREGQFEVGLVCDDQLNVDAGDDVYRGADSTDPSSFAIGAVARMVAASVGENDGVVTDNSLKTAVTAVSNDESDNSASAEEKLNSLEQVLRSELYPLKPIQTDDVDVEVPFPLLPGESVEYLSRAGDDGIIAMSNYRLFALHHESFLNIPIGLIDSVEYKDLVCIYIGCKDMRVLRCKLVSAESCQDWLKRIGSAIRPSRRLEDSYAFAFNAWCIEKVRKDGEESSLAPYRIDTSRSLFDKEVIRLGFDLKNAWRISYVNEKYGVCSSYPAYHIVPNSVNDEQLGKIANFRSSHRFPSVVWRDVGSGAVLMRCSQPEYGWFAWRSTDDENLPKAVAAAQALNPGPAALLRSRSRANDFSEMDAVNGSVYGLLASGISTTPASSATNVEKNILLIDARSYAAAVANRTKGGGYECQEYYPNCEITFMNLANIHAIRKSFSGLRTLLAAPADVTGYLTSLENTKWFHNISGLLRSALIAVNAIDRDHKSVLVHCSDGWDRTPQIVSLAELMLDPYYRTISGFQVLVEREWLEFGHRFADRCNQGLAVEDQNERCPVFVQWLDCVHQLLKQYPCAFQFNEAYLVKLVHHTYSCLFGDFLCNSVQQRQTERIKTKTLSVWALLSSSNNNNNKFINLLYREGVERVLRPECSLQSIRLWEAVYLADSNSLCGGVNGGGSAKDTALPPPAAGTSSSDGSSPVEDSRDAQLPAKTRSCEDLTSAVLEDAVANGVGCLGGGCAGPGLLSRRLSDPNLAGGGGGGVCCNGTEKGTERCFDKLDHGGSSSNTERFNCMSTEVWKEDIDRFPSKETLKAPDDDDEDCNRGESRTDTAPPRPTAGGETKELGDNCDKALVNGQSTRNGYAGGSVTPEHLEGGVIRRSEFEDSSETLTGGDAQCASKLNEAESVEDSPRCDEKNDELNASNSSENVSDDSSARTVCWYDARDEILTITARERGAENVVRKRDAGAALSFKDAETSQAKSATLSAVCACQSPPSSQSGARVAPSLAQQASAVAARKTCAVGAAPQQSTTALMINTKMALDQHLAALKENGGGAVDGLEVSQTTSQASTNPTTPMEDNKMILWSSRPTGNLTRRLDWDGLTSYVDPIQLRVAQIKAEHDQQIRNLESLLAQAKTEIRKLNNGTIGGLSAGLGFLNLSDGNDEVASTDSGDRGSVDGGSVVNSEMSWEQVEERDARMTLWVPDHVVTHCTNCEKLFWIACRKHHCRNCGKVFCHDCTKFNIPVPLQQLNNPVRVCLKCYETEVRLSGSLNNGGGAAAVGGAGNDLSYLFPESMTNGGATTDLINQSHYPSHF